MTRSLILIKFWIRFYYIVEKTANRKVCRLFQQSRRGIFLHQCVKMVFNGPQSQKSSKLSKCLSSVTPVDNFSTCYVSRRKNGKISKPLKMVLLPSRRPSLRLALATCKRTLATFNMSADGGTTITEGQATISFDGPSKAFYNPVQEFNRDLTITVLRAFSAEWNEKRQNFLRDETAPKAKLRRLEERRGLHVLEALSATGLRAIRFAKEVKGIEKIIANDFSASAVACIKRNIEANGVSESVHANYQDASAIMFTHRKFDTRFDVVDIDPYGSPAHFIDAAVQCVEDDGILMVTCTDVATLCGNHPEAAFMKYGAMPFRARACHELALRIVLQCVDARANVYDRYILPILSLSIDFYLRIFVRVKSGASQAKSSVTKRCMIYYCVGCETAELQPLATQVEPGAKGGVKFTAAHGPTVPTRCAHCDSRMRIGGPFWSDRLHDYEFVNRLLATLKSKPRLGTHDRLLGMLTVVSEELPDSPLYYDVSGMCKSAKCPAPKVLSFKSALLNAGYKCSITHARPRGVKTDAPAGVVWDVIRSWALKCEQLKPSDDAQGDPISRRIMSQTPKLQVDFTDHPDATPPSVVAGLLRFQDNKGKNWGPKTRTKGSVISTQAGMYNESDGKSDTEEASPDVL